MDVFHTGTGFITASALNSAVAANVQTTFASIAPVLELVVGIILAFIVAKYVISLFKHTGRASK